METAARAYRRQVSLYAREASIDDAVAQSLPMALEIAWERYRKTRVIPLEDLQQIAAVALIEVSRQYEWSQDKTLADFKTYAAIAIKNKLKKATSSCDGVGLRYKNWQRAWLLQRMEAEHGPMSEEQACEALGISPRALQTTRRALQAIAASKSLDTALNPGEGGPMLRDELPDPGPTPEDIVLGRIEYETDVAWLGSRLQELPRGVERAVSLAFGIPTVNTRTLALRDVFPAAIGSFQASKGVNMLREARQNEIKDLPKMVVDNAGTSYSGYFSGKTFTGESGKQKGLSIFESYSSGPDAPPGLVSAGGMG